MNREKREKIVQEFERFIQEYCRDIGCTSYDIEVLKGALALLKEQEPVKAMKLAVPFTRTEPIEFDYSCPVCMVGLLKHWTACPTCGTKVIF